MKRMKRVTSWMLVLCVMMTFLPAVVVADEAELVSIRVFNGNTESSYRVLFRNNDLYFPAEAFGKITRYLFTESENYGYQLGSKLIIVNPANGEIKIPVLHYTGNIGEVVTIDGTDYLSASQMLPWMNVTCSVEDGVLIVIPDKISLWQIVENFSYEHYMFNLYNEYGDSVSSVIGLSAMMVFDGIINFRYERLIPSDENSSLYDYECYVQALAEIGPNSVNEEGLRELRQYVDVNKGLDPIAEYLGVKLENGMNGLGDFLSDQGLGEEEIQEILKISETWEEMRQCASIPGIITEYYDIFEAYKAYELIVGTDNEYREYLAWLSEQGTGNTTFDRALEEAQTDTGQRG